MNPAPPFPSYPWRDRLGAPGVPPSSRERWGRRANALEDAGVPFPDSERLAFDQLAAEATAGRRGAGDRPPPPTAQPSLFRT